MPNVAARRGLMWVRRTGPLQADGAEFEVVGNRKAYEVEPMHAPAPLTGDGSALKIWVPLGDPEGITR